jgi:hypothetical protein
MKWLLVLFFLCSAVPAQHTESSYTTGNDLQEQCRVNDISSIREAFDGGFCSGFIEGYAQLAMMARSTPKMLCLPQQVTRGQVKRVIVKYFDEHPEKLHLPAAQLVYDATNKAFPCSADTK